MKRKRILIGCASLLTLCLFTIGANQAAACTQGCTPGFWKNHLEMWVGFNPYQTLGEALLCTDPSSPYCNPSWTWPAELI